MSQERLTLQTQSKGNGGQARPAAKGGVFIPHQPVWHQRLAAGVVYALIKSISSTVRYSYTDTSGFFEKHATERAIFCVWHNRLALCLKGYFSFAVKKDPTRRMAALVSASKDGAFLTAILEAFGVQPVRGSSSRRGAQGLLELSRWAAKGYDLAITPDGPRGPRYHVQDGVTSLAQITGLPILPAAYNLPRRVQLKTWDRFQIPYPLSSCQVVMAQPLRVPADASAETREQLRQQLEQALLRINKD